MRYPNYGWETRNGVKIAWVLLKEALHIMKKDYLRKVWIIVIGMILLISACSPSRVSVEEYNLEAGIESTVEVQATPTPVVETEPGEEAQPVVPVKSTYPEDVPIMEGAYQLQAARKGTNVLYQIDATVDEVVTYYQNELPNFGWEMAGPPDNAVGAIATMLRENEAGDRLAINMQANELGGFVRLTITISRVN